MPSEDKYPEPMPMYEATLAQQQNTNMMAGAVMDHRPTVSEQLAMRKAHLEHELAQVNAAIEHALANTPTMALLDSIAKVGLLR